MKLTTIGAYFYFFLLIIFSYVLTFYLSNFAENDSRNAFRISFVLDVMCLGLIVFIWRGLKFTTPVVICISWILAMSLVYLANGSTLGDLASMVLWPLCFLATYLLLLDNPELASGFKYVFVFIFLIGIGFFFNQWMNPLLVTDTEEQNRFNLVFFPLLTTPWILLLKNRWLKSGIFILIFIVTLLSQKRSAFMIMIVMLLPYIISEVKSYKNRVASLLVLGLLVAIFSTLFIVYSETEDSNIIERMNDISEDEGSGRIPIYYAVMELQSRSSLIEWIFGHGHFAVRRDSPFFMSAHNDFLETLYDYGAIVFGIYIWLWVYVTKKLIRLYKEKSEYFISYFSGYAVFVFMSMVSHLILYASNFIYLVCFWGAIEALQAQSENKLTTEKE